jgi:drug/metabolite transporter (DMT)-like permease
VGPTAIAFWRTAIGAAVLFGVAAVAGTPLRLAPGALAWSCAAGIIFFADLTCWHRSIVHAGAGMATILGNLQVFATAALSWFVFRERLSLRFSLAAAAAFAGVVLLAGIGSDEVAFTSTYLVGVLLGLATAAAYSGYIISLKKGRLHPSRPDLVAFVAWTSLFSAVFLGAGAIFEDGAFLPTDVVTWLAVAGLGVFVQALAWLAITGALPRVPTAQAGLILLLQPTLATVWGVLFFAERLTGLQAFGAGVTLVAMYFGSLDKKDG